MGSSPPRQQTSALLAQAELLEALPAEELDGKFHSTVAYVVLDDGLDALLCPPRDYYTAPAHAAPEERTRPSNRSK